ncbi:cysteine dioxygenase [Microlunatus soli]|uniref:Cysteine dioxygenase type I n=1 Tax=Microlunatus soli TaxID=630515 RepID=A0A1H1VHA8_9ACTN|nr:cysteine dioxygenase family protein [Microlunatus soli]SDS83960.1 Cysteine dioxygenase type I [Microlunatus soli]
MNSVTDRRETALSAEELTAWTQQYAAEVRAGRHPVHADSQQRWHVRLHADDRADVWLISWTTEQGTELHDHGDSAGAFTVVDGELTESLWTPDGLTDIFRSRGETVVFDRRYVHDVRNHAERTAVSVHVYSPPLTLMHYYEVADGELVRRDSLWTDDPEAAAPRRTADR